MPHKKPKFILLILIYCFVFLLFFSNYLNKYDNLLNEIQLEESREQGFVTYATLSHLGLLQILVESVHLFSNKTIIAYSIDTDIPFDYPRLIKKRISLSQCGRNIFNCKPYVILKSNLKYGVYLDVDSLVNYNIDLLFDIAKAWNGNYTLSPIHPSDPKNQDFYLWFYGVEKKTMPYVHGHVIWNFNSLAFIQEWFKLSQKILSANYDETALNLLLWKQNAKYLVAAYDPFALVHFEEYLSNTFVRKPLPYYYMVFHGSKKYEYSSDMFKKLKIHSENDPRIQNIYNADYCPEDRKTRKTFFIL